MTDIGHFFHPVDIQCGHIHIVGGYSSKKSPVTARTVAGSDRTQHIFVKMSMGEQWMKRIFRSNLKRSGSSLLNLLRTHIRRKTDGIDDLDDEEVPADDEYDPMNESGCEVDANASVPRAGRNGRARYKNNRAKNCIVTVNMPRRCSGMDPTCKDMRLVTLYIVDRLTVWLSINDVAWALQYMNDEMHLDMMPVGAHNSVGSGAAVASRMCSD